MFEASYITRKPEKNPQLAKAIIDDYACSLYFRSDKKSKEQRVYNMNTGLQECLGQRLCSQLLFIHAFTLCDTTSRVFGMGKKTFFQKAAKGDKVRIQGPVSLKVVNVDVTAMVTRR